MRATASAPASIGNVAVGFDIVGQAFDAVRDRVTAVRTPEAGVRLGVVSGLVESLPAEPGRNTALAAAAAVLATAGAPFGMILDIEKNVPLSAGMGGSAASAVAAAAAANALLGAPFTPAALLRFAIEGERAAADPPPWDNVAASLFGGLVLIAREDPPMVRRLPVPPGIVAIVLHPDAAVETRMARAVLRPEVPMALTVEHGRRVASFVAGCASADLDLLRVGLCDLLVEPQRAHFLPALPAVKQAALAAGALGCSFSGSGPSVFAWALEGDAHCVEEAMARAFAGAGVAARAFRAGGESAGMRVEAEKRSGG